MKILALITLIASIGCAWPADWSYEDQNSWPEQCNGDRQSPIPLNTKNATKNNSLKTKFSLGYYKLVKENVTNNGATLLYQLTSSEKLPYVKGILPNEKFLFSRIFLHWPSEHTIDGKRYDLEVQLAHFREKYETFESSLTKPDGIFVISRIYKIGLFPNLLIAPAISAAAKTAHQPFVSKKLFGLLASVLPLRKNNAFFRYKGSVPIPDCTENAIYQVYTKPSCLSKSQFKKLTTIYNKEGKRIVNNNRKLQPVNGREIFYKKCWF